MAHVSRGARGKPWLSYLELSSAAPYPELAHTWPEVGTEVGIVFRAPHINYW